MAPYPFRTRPCQGKQQRALQVIPALPRDQRDQSGIDRQDGGEAQDNEGQHPGELRPENKQGVPDPVQPEDKETKTEPPAGKECGTAGRRPRHQPEHRRKDQEVQGKQIYRRQRKGKDATETENRRISPPSGDGRKPARGVTKYRPRRRSTGSRVSHPPRRMSAGSESAAA